MVGGTVTLVDGTTFENPAEGGAEAEAAAEAEADAEAAAEAAAEAEAEEEAAAEEATAEEEAAEEAKEAESGEATAPSGDAFRRLMSSASSCSAAAKRARGTKRAGAGAG